MNLSDLRILVCDENRSHRRMVKRLVMDIGVGEVLDSPVIFGSTAPVTTAGPDMIIGRLSEDDKAILELIKWLRNPELTPLPGVPVLVTIAKAKEELLTMAIKTGADLLVAEPLTLGSIEKRVVSLLTEPPRRITVKTYIGPDRRRTPGTAYFGAERRQSDKAKAATA